MAARIPPLTPIPSGELVRYEEMKRLAEMAWASSLASPGAFERLSKSLCECAWADAEAMYAESERRRPVE